MILHGYTRGIDLAGRSKEKLEAVKEQLSCDAPTLIIDSESQIDIQNAYITAPSSEKHYIICGTGFR